MNEGIQAIVRQIDADAAAHSQERLSQIKARTDSEITRENERFAADLTRRREMLVTNNNHELRHRLERYSRRLNRWLFLYRRELLDEIFDMAAEKLSAISGQEYMDIFINAIGKLRGDFTLYIGEYSREKLSAETVWNAARQVEGFDIVMSPDYIPRKNGFILSNGAVEYNYLFEDMIEDRKNELSSLMQKEVFDEL